MSTDSELLALNNLIQGCTKCGLAKSRTQTVVGSGNHKSKIVFVGEAPGENEDLSGRPFVGRSGKRLEDAMRSIGLTRDDVYICNVIKCRPPGNRNPQPEEILACKNYLDKQLEIVRPRLIVTLGTFATQTLLKTKAPMSDLRKNVFSYHGTPLLPTWHPAYTLYNSSKFKDLLTDMKAVENLLTQQTNTSANNVLDIWSRQEGAN